jgi:exodeoxyribonuclease VII large subunit
VPHGRYQMVARTLRESGLGELLARLEALRQRLAAEGLFEEARKRPLPFLPRRVGVVTAVTGAAIRDIIETIQNRYPTQILIYPTAVQGPGSAERIARGIARLDAVPDVDVIIVGRGGGSLQDLWAFNEEVVVRAIARCETPVISAVGHEVDTLLSDAAADVRAATPTAAGELAVPNMADLRYTLQGHTDRMQRATRFRVSEGRVALAGTLRRMGDPRRLVGERQQLVDELLFRGQMGMQKRLAKAREGRAILQARLKNLHPRNRIQASRGELTHLEMRLETAARRLMASLRTSLHGHEAALEHLSPIASLERGYAIVRSTKGGVLTDAGKVQQGDELQILLHRGAIGARVVDTDSKNDFEPESP